MGQRRYDPKKIPHKLSNGALFSTPNLLILHDSGYLDGLGDAVEQGLVKAVGVSNYSGWLSN